MLRWIKNYRALSFEKRTIFNTRFSIALNGIIALIKGILAIFNIAFLVSGIINIFILMAKLECYLGVEKAHRKSFRFRNNLIALFLILAGLQYTIYMSRLLFTDIPSRGYGPFLGIMIALVSFIELGVAIKGCFNAFGRGHYYRNIKLISLCSAFTAIALTELSIMSFAETQEHRLMDGLFGVVVGGIIILIGVYIFFAPKISIVDREHNVYKMEMDSPLWQEEKITYPLTYSRIYGNYCFEGIIQKDRIDGFIRKGSSPIFQWNIFVILLIGLLSEILIFPYAVGALIFHLKNATLISKLDKLMEENKCVKLIEEELENV